MEKESSPPGDITESTYTDLGAATREARAISLQSRRLARAALGDTTLEDRIRQRCSIAVGDFAMAGLLRFCNSPVEGAIAALGKEAPIITDIRMVQVGIQKKGHHSPVLCALDHGAGRADEEGMTRSSAGIRALADQIGGSTMVIGNAPSALLALCDLIARNTAVPACVIGIPVGFVQAAESKALLRTLPVPSISTEGTRGGTPVAVAAMNEIITIAVERGV
jgi:precorrin-8X/cobalt-precorrin-8 methylmutase